MTRRVVTGPDGDGRSTMTFDGPEPVRLAVTILPAHPVGKGATL